MKKLPVSPGVLLGFALGLALLMGIGYMSAQSTRAQHDNAQWVAHTQEVRLALDQLVRSLVEATSARRGYVLSDDNRFLPPYERAVGRIGELQTTLRSLTADNPHQQERLRAMAPLLERQIALLRRSIEWTQGPAKGPVDQAALTLSSRELLQEISRGTDAMSAEESTLLTQRQALARASVERSRWITGVGMLAGILMLLAVFARMLAETVARRRSEGRAIASEARLAGILDIAEDAIITFDHQMRIVLFNKGAEKIFGYTAREALGSSLDTLIPSRYDVSQASDGKTFNERREIFGRRKNGAEFPAEASLSRLDLGHERVFTVILRDVSARKRLEEERDRYFAFSADLMCVAGEDGYFKRLNPAWERTLGWSLEELMSRPYEDFIHPEDRSSTGSETARAAHSERVAGFRNRYRCKDGSYRWLSWTSPGVAPSSTDIHAAARDVTEEILAETRISSLNVSLEARAAQLAASNKELEAFCYSISHDLRAPLRAIDGFSQILEDERGDALDQEGRRLLGLIRGNTHRMGQLIDDLLAFSRMGRQAMRRTRVEMQELAESVARELTEAAAPRRIIVTIGALPAAMVDSAMIRQVWVNLLSNAVKYTRDRETARIEVSGRIDGDEAVYSVLDNGVGFDMRYAHKLFGVFQRLHSVAEYEGTGVGLALAQRIVLRHGGRIWVDGRTDGGATFTFTLPRKDKTEPIGSAPETESREETAHA